MLFQDTLQKNIQGKNAKKESCGCNDILEKYSLTFIIALKRQTAKSIILFAQIQRPLVTIISCVYV